MRFLGTTRARARAIHDESALGISARSVRADVRADLNETESENFSAYQGCPNAATRINTHATIVIDIQRATTVDPPCGRGKNKKKKKKRYLRRQITTKKKKKNERRKRRWRRNDDLAGGTSISWPWKKEAAKYRLLFRITCNFFRKRRRRRRRYGGDTAEQGGKDDDDDDGGGLHAGSALFFGRRCTGARENKHRKDRNCFSERFDSRQMNLLKYTRNSTSRQYLHGRGGRIYIRAGCTAPFKPPSVSTTRRYGPCGRSFYCCRAARSGSKKKSHAQREIERSFFFFFCDVLKQDSVSCPGIDTMRGLIAKITPTIGAYYFHWNTIDKIIIGL